MNQPADCQMPSNEIPSRAVWVLVSQGTEISRTPLIGPFSLSSNAQVTAMATDERIVGTKKTERKRSRPTIVSFSSIAIRKPRIHEAGPKRSV